MSYSKSLRFRVSISFLLIGSLLAVLEAVAIYWVAERIEAEFLAVTLNDELDFLLEQIGDRDDPLPAARISSKLRFYATGTGEPPPAFVTDLPLGIHEIESDGVGYEVLVSDRLNRRFYLLYDESAIDRIEAWLLSFLVVGVLAFSYASLWLGFWISGRVIAPVRELSHRVRELEPEADTPPLVDRFPDDEVGDLAGSFDLYRARIRRFVRRERDFTDDVSHELRTSLAVMSSTVQLVLAQESAGGEVSAAALQRLRRAIEKMERMVEVFLILARERPAEGLDGDEVALHDLLAELIAKRRSAARARESSLILDGVGESVEIHAPQVLVEIVLGNLLDNALFHTRRGEIVVTVDGSTVTVEDEGRGIPAHEQDRIFERGFRGTASNGLGSGLGLAIVKRLCEHHGWSVDIESLEGAGTRAVVIFGQEQQRGGDVGAQSGRRERLETVDPPHAAAT